MTPNQIEPLLGKYIVLGFSRWLYDNRKSTQQLPDDLQVSGILARITPERKGIGIAEPRSSRGPLKTNPDGFYYLPISQLDWVQVTEKVCCACYGRSAFNHDELCLCDCHEDEDEEELEEVTSTAFAEPVALPRLRIVTRDGEVFVNPPVLINPPIPVNQPIVPTYEPPRLPRAAIAGMVEVGTAELRVEASGVQLAWPDDEGFPRYLNLSDDEITDMALAGYLACAMLDQAAEVRPMAITLEQLSKTLAVAQRFVDAAGAAEQVLKPTGNPTHTPITGSKETGALRRASLDLTRALADLRRPQ